MQHVKDGVVASLLISVGAAVFPFAVLVLRGVNNVYPPDVAPLFMALFPWATLWFLLVWLMLEFRAYRYADGLSFREILQKLTLYTVEKKFGRTVFENAIATLGMYWFFNWIVYIVKNPSPDHYHVFVALFVTVATPVVLAVVVGWVLDVFTRRLFGEALGKFLFATFVAGAVFHPLLGVFTSFLFSWAMFGRSKDAAVATAVAALSLFAVMLPGWVWTSVFLL
jgi:MFS family permease